MIKFNKYTVIEKSLATILLTTSLFFSVGCSTLQKKEIPDVIIERRPPAEILVSCEIPSELKNKSFSEIVRKLDETSGLLHSCKSKHDELVEFYKRGDELSNK